MTEKLPDVCERVSSSTPTTMVLGGAPDPYREFRDVLAVGEVCQYELIYCTRSLTSTLIETGLAQYAAGNELRRVTPFRSVEDDAPVTFEAGSSTGYFFVRVQPRDDANVNRPDVLELNA